MRSKVPWKKLILAAGFVAALGGSGCARNVDRIEFEKWGSSYLPKNFTTFDTTAQGGSPVGGVVPQSPNYQLPKTSVGGTHHRTFATSSRYRMVGGFHGGQ